MSDLLPVPPEPPESRLLPPKGAGGEDPPSSIEPKNAILSAAIICLEYAKQYLDKFTYWPDYILATHYHANILALTKNWKDAEKYFRDVEFWLAPDGRHGSADDARRRIRVEAMYNRAVLTERRGETVEARKQFEAVREILGGNKVDGPKGVRFATEFALLMLTARELGFARAAQQISVGNANRSPEQKAQLRSDWKTRIISFLADCDAEIRRLRQELAVAKTDLDQLVVSQPRGKDDEPSPTVKNSHNNPGAKAKRSADLDLRRKSAMARITKATKDLAILRMMADQTTTIQEAFVSEA